MSEANPGAQLAALRRTEEKVCPECGITFTARLIAVYCSKCSGKMRVRKHRQKTGEP